MKEEEEGNAAQSDSEAEGLDGTIRDFEAYEQQKKEEEFLNFCAAWDKMSTGNC